MLMSKLLGSKEAVPRRLWPGWLHQLVLVAPEKQAGCGGRRKTGRDGRRKTGGDSFLLSKLVPGYMNP